jgi:hypothetical protein
MVRKLSVIVLLGISALPSAATSEPYRVPQTLHPPGGAEPVGCYWSEGHRYCSRYCYWDVDGFRYCRESQELAFPQGPVAIAPAPLYPYAPLK